MKFTSTRYYYLVELYYVTFELIYTLLLLIYISEFEIISLFDTEVPLASFSSLRFLGKTSKLPVPVHYRQSEEEAGDR
jgi:hypothetical protein